MNNNQITLISNRKIKKYNVYDSDSVDVCTYKLATTS